MTDPQRKARRLRLWISFLDGMVSVLDPWGYRERKRREQAAESVDRSTP